LPYDCEYHHIERVTPVALCCRILQAVKNAAMDDEHLPTHREAAELAHLDGPSDVTSDVATCVDGVLPQFRTIPLEPRVLLGRVRLERLRGGFSGLGSGRSTAFTRLQGGVNRIHGVD
jgi:hypothetical protein